MKDTKELTAEDFKAPPSESRSPDDPLVEIAARIAGPATMVSGDYFDGPRDLRGEIYAALRAAESRGRERGIEEAARRVSQIRALYEERAAQLLADPAHDFDVPVAQRHQAVAAALIYGEGEIRALTSGASAPTGAPESSFPRDTK